MDIRMFLLACAQALAPGQRYDLSSWKLQTCLRSPREVLPSQLHNYSDANFFLSTDGAMVLRTPDNGPAITSHASHPRTEFREVGVPDWAVDAKSTHELSVNCTVMRVSNTSGKTVIAQVHGSAETDERAKLLKLQWGDGRLQARVKNTSAPYSEFGLDIGYYRRGEALEVRVSLQGPELTVRVNGRSVSYRPPVNQSDRFYFKAGDYDQCQPCGSSDQFAEVLITALNTRHVVVR